MGGPSAGLGLSAGQSRPSRSGRGGQGGSVSDCPRSQQGWWWGLELAPIRVPVLRAHCDHHGRSPGARGSVTALHGSLTQNLSGLHPSLAQAGPCEVFSYLDCCGGGTAKWLLSSLPFFPSSSPPHLSSLKTFGGEICITIS